MTELGLSSPVFFLHPDSQVRLRKLVDPQCLPDHSLVNHDAAFVDLLIQMVLIPDKVRNRIILQALLDLYFHLHIAIIVFFEQLPFIQRVANKGIVPQYYVENSHECCT